MVMNIALGSSTYVGGAIPPSPHGNGRLWAIFRILARSGIVLTAPGGSRCLPRACNHGEEVELELAGESFSRP